ncbi:aminopeptidase sgcX [Salmonella enterica subsp. enterica]|nr:aminopeptidase sgcX [Salmonella enterica subsp. enterica]
MKAVLQTLCSTRLNSRPKDVWRDRLGNVVARYGSDKSDALRLMIFAHMDEVGFMVRKIEPSGFLRF